MAERAREGAARGRGRRGRAGRAQTLAAALARRHHRPFALQRLGQRERPLAGRVVARAPATGARRLRDQRRRGAQPSAGPARGRPGRRGPPARQSAGGAGGGRKPWRCRGPVA